MTARASSILILILLLTGCGDSGPGATSDPASTTMPATSQPATTTTTTTLPAETTRPATTTSIITVDRVPTGRLEGTVTGWPAEVVSCSATLQAWGPYPYQMTEVECAPGAGPAPFVFEVLPAGNWGIRAWLTWTDPLGVEHRRMNEYPTTADPQDRIVVAADATTTLDLVADRPGGALIGTVFDDVAGLPVGAQFEPGASLIHVLAYGEDGTLVGTGGNGCDGTYQVWLPEGRYAVAAVTWYYDPPLWENEWVVTGEAYEVPAGWDPWLALDPAAIPTGAWIEVNDGIVIDPDIHLDQAPGLALHIEGGWFPWFVEPVAGGTLPADHAWRERGTWVGHRVVLEERLCCPPQLILDGRPVDLAGWGHPTPRGAADLLIVASPSPPEDQFAVGGAPAYLPGYHLVLAVNAAGIVTDALYLETGPERTVTTEGLAPHLPGEAIAVLGAREAGCTIFSGPALRAWRVAGGLLVEVDPAGIAVVPAG